VIFKIMVCKCFVEYDRQTAARFSISPQLIDNTPIRLRSASGPVFDDVYGNSINIMS